MAKSPTLSWEIDVPIGDEEQNRKWKENYLMPEKDVPLTLVVVGRPVRKMEVENRYKSPYLWDHKGHPYLCMCLSIAT